MRARRQGAASPLAPEANVEAQKIIEQAIELDPNYAHAHAWRACIVGQSWIYGWCADRDVAGTQFVENSDRAIAR